MISFSLVNEYIETLQYIYNALIHVYLKDKQIQYI